MDAATLLHALPELNMSLVTPQDLPPPVLRPGLVALGPSRGGGASETQ